MVEYMLRIPLYVKSIEHIYADPSAFQPDPFTLGLWMAVGNFSNKLSIIVSCKKKKKKKATTLEKQGLGEWECFHTGITEILQMCECICSI